MCAGTVACMKRFMKKCPWAQGATRGEQNISGPRLGRMRRGRVGCAARM